MKNTALGYSIRQEAALSCFLDDERLAIDNNASERARTIAVGRKAWLFAGSDDAAQSAASSRSTRAEWRLP